MHPTHTQTTSLFEIFLILMTPSHLNLLLENHIVTATSSTVFWDTIHCNVKKRKEDRTGQKTPLSRKEYIFFQMDSECAYAAKCVKSRLLNKVVD